MAHPDRLRDVSLRSVFGLLALVSMLQVNLRVAYAACAATDSSKMAESTDSKETESPRASHAFRNTEGYQPTRSARDSPVACCQAMTSCGTVIGPGRVIQTAF